MTASGGLKLRCRLRAGARTVPWTSEGVQSAHLDLSRVILSQPTVVISFRGRAGEGENLRQTLRIPLYFNSPEASWNAGPIIRTLDSKPILAPDHSLSRLASGQTRAVVALGRAEMSEWPLGLDSSERILPQLATAKFNPAEHGVRCSGSTGSPARAGQ